MDLFAHYSKYFWVKFIYIEIGMEKLMLRIGNNLMNNENKNMFQYQSRLFDIEFFSKIENL